MSALSLPLIGFSVPLLFSKINQRSSIGEIMIGFALIFMGLEYMKVSVPNINSNPEVLSFLTNYTDLGLWSYFIFLAIGTFLTAIIQSSSATMTLTLAMDGDEAGFWITFWEQFKPAYCPVTISHNIQSCQCFYFDLVCPADSKNCYKTGTFQGRWRRV